VISFEGSGNGAIHADVQIQNQKIRIYAIHLQSTKLGNAADEVLKGDNLSSLNKKETQEKYIKVEEKLSNAFEMRAIQAREIAAHIADSPYPVILCGDLNDIPMSYSYRIISKGLKDSFTERGKGLGTTYAGSLPMLRIDYIFTSKMFEVLKHQIQDKAITDHYALTSDLNIK
jgi:endonuclease/exonuclease/phosphatase family metal-dependent hydrolase